MHVRATAHSPNPIACLAWTGSVRIAVAR